MKITFCRRKGYIGSLVGFSVRINGSEVQCLYPGETFVYEGNPKDTIEVSGSLTKTTFIPVADLQEENNIYLQYAMGFWFYPIQAIVYSKDKLIGVYEKERLF